LLNRKTTPEIAIDRPIARRKVNASSRNILANMIVKTGEKIAISDIFNVGENVAAT
jgi:hypothetical protein